MRVFDHLVDSLSRLFKFHNYSPFEKAYAALLFIAGLSLRDISERYYASRESVRDWIHRLRSLFIPERKPRRLVAVDEKRLGCRIYIWSAMKVYDKCIGIPECM